MQQPAPRPVAILKIDDADRTVAWYAAAGFTLRGRLDQDASTWVEVEREGTVIQFLSGETPWDGEPRLTGCLYVHVDDIEQALADLKSPVSSEWGVEHRDWGAREVVLQDPDGYLITLTAALVPSAADPRSGRD